MASTAGSPPAPLAQNLLRVTFKPVTNPSRMRNTLWETCSVNNDRDIARLCLHRPVFLCLVFFGIFSCTSARYFKTLVSSYSPDDSSASADLVIKKLVGWSSYVRYSLTIMLTAQNI